MTSMADLLGRGLLKPGEEIFATSRKWPATAYVNADGSINYDGETYKTPSAAAVAVRQGRATNDWTLWHVHRDEHPVPLTLLRDELQGAVTPLPSETEVSTKPVVGENLDPEDSDAEGPGLDEDVEDPGLVTAFGMFWRRSQVDWKRGRNVRLLGHSGEGSTVDFAGQIGVYLLHDGARTVYVGRDSKPRLGARLWEHTRDRLSGRWDRFSWFGLRPLLSNGALGEAGDRFGTDLVVSTMEAVLIEGLEPPQNRRRGDGTTGQEYQQVTDPKLRKQELLAALMEQF